MSRLTSINWTDGRLAHIDENYIAIKGTWGLSQQSNELRRVQKLGLGTSVVHIRLIDLADGRRHQTKS